MIRSKLFSFHRLMVVAIALSSVPLWAGRDFAKDIQPIFARHCYECHGAEKQKGKLRLDDRQSVFREGAKIVIPGDAEKSELVRRISLPKGHEDIMPSRGEPLSKGQVAAIREWIDEGAVWPEHVELARHWAYVPPARPVAPIVKEKGWVRNEIDRFVLARLEKENLRPSPETDRARLLRRVCLDLTGLPPTPKEVEAFVADASPDAYEKVVDRLLASPHYGERWARPWLDAARYADSNGFQRDNLWDVWPYRDWVVRAFNADMPFDQFTIEQIAGDLLPDATPDQKIATGFNRCTATNIEAGSDQEETRVNQVFDRVNTLGTVWLGTTLECAQCHNHKYDPFSQKEYYQFFAFFNNTIKETDKLNPNATASLKFIGPYLDLPDEQLTAKRAELQAAIQGLDEKIAAATQRVFSAQSDWETKLKAEAANAAKIHVLDVTTFEAESDSPHEIQADKSILLRAEDNAAIPAKDTYTVSVTTKLTGITGFKLDVLTDPSLPGTGPGRGDEKRPNFVLTDFSISIQGEDGKLHPVKLRNAKASFGQKNFQVANAIDGNPRTGWAIAPEFFKDHWATFETESPLGSAAGVTFVFKLEQENGAARTIGRFRLSAMTGQQGLTAIPADIVTILSKPAAERTPAQQTQLTTFISNRDSEVVKLKSARAKLATQLKGNRPPRTLVMEEMAERRASTMFVRGNFLEKGEPVEPNVPAVLNPLPDGPRNRLTLAQWLVSTNNPLVARVTVNRWWAEIFGRGLVATPEDFGIKGDLPTHPELLDWLATEFMTPADSTAKLWSMKHIHRLIVTSATYRQSSQITPQLRQVDDQNKLYARGPRFRMDAEMIRDNALAAAGLLSTKLGGPPVRPYQPPGIWESKVGGEAVTYELSEGEDRYRRGIYTVWKRTSPYPSFITFDAPNRNSCVIKRARSNTPLQALTLLNDPVYVEAAHALARRVLADMPAAATIDRIRYAFQLCTARPPTTRELEYLLKLHEEQVKASRQDSAAAGKLLSMFGDFKGVAAPEFAAWFSISTALLNLDETITKG